MKPKPTWSSPVIEALRGIFQASKWEHAKAIDRMQKAPKGKRRLRCNVHGDPRFKPYTDRWKAFHIGFKYRFLVPALSLLDRYFGKQKLKTVPNTPHNYLLKAFDDAFEKALRLWMKHVLFSGKLNCQSTKVINKEFDSNHCILRLRSLKNWYLTMGVQSPHIRAQELKSGEKWYVTGMSMDQTYKEFHNILMFCLYEELHKVFSEKFSKDKVGYHLFYRDRAVDQVEYFSLFEFVQKEIRIGKHEQRENLPRPKDAPVQGQPYVMRQQENKLGDMDVKPPPTA